MSYAPLPSIDGGFKVLLADPPWVFATHSEKGQGKSPSRHYDCMPTAEIAAMPVGDMMAPDSCVFLWTTAPHLQHGMDVLKAWGFKYSTLAFVWVKTNRQVPRVADMRSLFTGTGYTTRLNAEFVLYGRRGKVKRLDRSIHQVILAPVREHSRKPDEASERIERLFDGPRVELFARQHRKNWTSWGNQVGLFDAAP